MRLWLVRHAKSSWADPGQTDFERGLNARGRRDGPLMASWLRQQCAPATWIWSSAAVRALATTDFVAAGFATTAEHVQTHSELYHGSPEAVMQVLQQTPQGHDVVAVVAHNPGLTYLLNLLAGHQVTDNLPTFGVAEFELPSAWDNNWLNCRLPTPGATTGTCQLRQLQSPKSIKRLAATPR